jgi:hypothetical protein
MFNMCNIYRDSTTPSQNKECTELKLVNLVCGGGEFEVKCYIVGKISFLGMFLIVNFFTSKLMIISWSSVFFWRFFAYHF